MQKAEISIVVVALNEEKALPALLNSINEQTYCHDKIEIILVDSRSQDGTKKIMAEFASKNDFYRVLCLDNLKKIQASGWNTALARLGGRLIIRLDAHAVIPPDFIQKNVDCIGQGHDICGGKVVNYMPQESEWGAVVNMSESSMFGGSVAAFRRKDTACIVSTLAFAAYRKEVFDKVGCFNENLLRTEDNEMHYRMRKAGYEFYYTPDIISYRETRPNFRRLLKQKYLNGYWIGLTMGICPRCFSLYHFIPTAFVFAVVFTAFLACCGIWQAAAFMWSLYGLITILITSSAAVQTKGKNLFVLLLPFLFLLLHTGYGLGTITGLLYMPVWKKSLHKRRNCYEV